MVITSAWNELVYDPGFVLILSPLLISKSSTSVSVFFLDPSLYQMQLSRSNTSRFPTCSSLLGMITPKGAYSIPD